MTHPRCVFCGAIGSLTNEHVMSASIQRLAATSGRTPIEFNDGSPQLWGALPNATSLSDLTVRCVCAKCNNEWMGELDNRFAKDLLWWCTHPSSKLGPQRERVVRRYLTKLLWVVRLGEDWATSAWITGDAREPEFIPLTIVKDGERIASARPADIDDLGLKVSIGAAHVDPGARQLLMVPPIAVDGLARTSKLERVNAGLELTLRGVAIRLYVVASSLDDRWQVRWPRGVVSLTPHTRYRLLSTVSDSGAGAPRLTYTGPPPRPDLEALYGRALDLAHDALEQDRNWT